MSILPDFSIFAIRILKEGSTGQRILKANQFYYLQKGYEISGTKIIYSESESTIDCLYDYFIGREGSPLRVTVSAIVGANGSGKSSLVEYMLRLLNNFAASLFGEAELHPGAEHLHYIDGIYGEMYYMLDCHPHMLRIDGDKVELFEYTPKKQSEEEELNGIFQFEREADSIYLRNARRHWRGDKDIRFFSKWRKKPEVYQRIADHVFYTFVSNYSIYAYNSQDYKDEWNSEDLELFMRSADYIKYLRDNDYQLKDQCCWLEGIFHKNDGYQTPIVLTPYRVRGNMDVNKESLLSSERLLTLLLKGLGYKKLNAHLEVVGFDFSVKAKDFGLKYLQKACTDFNARERGYRKIRNAIVDSWKKKYHLSFAKSERLDGYEKALDYLASKTIKVASRYIQYRKYYEKLSNVEKWVKQKHIDEVRGLVDVMSKDKSHITTKIRQTLCYLSRGAYQADYLSLEDAINTAKASLRSVKDDWRNGSPLIYTRTEDVLPAPIIDVRIKLKESNGCELIMDKLSSGEKQQIYAISSILYHLSNIDSVHTDMNRKRVGYRRVSVILEEIELYYHPELQRQFLMYLLDGLKQVRLSEIVALNILVVTHSPFVLSDIQPTSILALKDGVPQDRQLQTFGANIHDLLNSGFFMEDGSRGLFAEWIIKDIVKALDIYIKEASGSTISNEESRFLLNYKRNRIYRLILSIDEPIIQKVLLEKYKQAFTKQTVDERILELQQELKRLRNVAPKSKER